MSKFCTQCGAEMIDEAMFCSKCGSSFGFQTQNQGIHSQQSVNQGQNVNQTQGPCLKCGSLTPYNSDICHACGEVDPHKSKDRHTLAIVFGYIFSFLTPIIGIIFAIYLLTRKNKDVNKHGIIQLAISVTIWIVSAFLVSL